jgi:hypothetical protein
MCVHRLLTMDEATFNHNTVDMALKAPSKAWQKILSVFKPKVTYYAHTADVSTMRLFIPQRTTTTNIITILNWLTRSLYRLLSSTKYSSAPWFDLLIRRSSGIPGKRCYSNDGKITPYVHTNGILDPLRL